MLCDKSVNPVRYACERTGPKAYLCGNTGDLPVTAIESKMLRLRPGDR